MMQKPQHFHSPAPPPFPAPAPLPRMVIPPLAESKPAEQVDEFLPTYSMMAYLPQQQVLERALGIFDD